MEGTNTKNLRFTKLATEFFPDSFFSEKCPSHSSKFKNCARMFAETHVIELTAMSVFFAFRFNIKRGYHRGTILLSLGFTME